MPDAYGPQTPYIEALLTRAQALTGPEITELGAAWEAARGKARDAAWFAAGDAAGAAWFAADAVGAAWNVTGADGGVAWAAAWDTARHADWSVTRAARAAVVDAALALATRDQLPPEHYRTLTGPWGEVAGKAHPDDPDRRGGDT
jgi:hypothetical protein